jgi:hypothetical protein
MHTMEWPCLMARFRLYSGNKGFSKPPPRTGDTLSRAGWLRCCEEILVAVVRT